jgi:hypothetical protein
MAVIAALAITILVKIGPAHYSAAVLSPASSPNQRLPFIAFGWLFIGAGIAGLLRARRPAVFQALGRRAAPDESS